jgi:glycerol-3-phosphate cytidylyltransferase
MVIAENDWEQKIKDIQKYNVDIFSIGDDWKGKFDFLKEYCEVIYLDRTEGISSTQLKNTLKTFSVSKDELIKAFDILEQLKKDFE